MFQVIPSPIITSRDQFALFCNERKVRVAVEVGTDIGLFARKFMEQFEGDDLICVDSYRDYEYMSADYRGVRLPDMMMAVIALAPWHGRVKILHQESREAARRLPDWLGNRLDFVYIDASHDYASVDSDISSWWERLQPGGILAGHDYAAQHQGVIDAVNLFAQSQGFAVYLTTDDPIPSWYILKPA